MPSMHISSSMSLSFLRPMRLPRPSTLQHFLGVARISTTTPSPSSTPPRLSTPATLPSSSSSSGIVSLSRNPIPYRITRTPSNNLPIYLLRKRGGNLLQTKLRRIEGDIKALRADLQAALGVDEKDVVINHLTKQIIVKGHKKPEVTKFLEDRRV